MLFPFHITTTNNTSAFQWRVNCIDLISSSIAIFRKINILWLRRTTSFITGSSWHLVSHFLHMQLWLIIRYHTSLVNITRILIIHFTGYMNNRLNFIWFSHIFTEFLSKHAILWSKPFFLMTVFKGFANYSFVTFAQKHTAWIVDRTNYGTNVSISVSATWICFKLMRWKVGLK